MQDKKILIVEDDQPIAELLAYRLGKEGFTVLTAATGSKGLELAQAEQPDLLLLDWMLPDISGLDVCQQVTQTRKIPIIMVTAKNLVEDKILGLEAGADDYITKPFDVREVVARIKATFRRLEAQAEPSSADSAEEISFADIHIDPKGMTVTKAGQVMELTHLEYSLLMYFYQNCNQVLTRDQILDSVWGYSYFGNTRTVDIHVLRLRRKLGLDEQIQTVFKVGYKFII
ncbi:MAG: response regulator transcription factor [Eubacteriales bacterium]|nr:response regulator transcription factor [Eubacteriales bacterium]